MTWLTEPPEGRFSGPAPERFTIPYALTDDECDRLVSLYQDLQAAEPTRFTGFSDRIQYLGLNGGLAPTGEGRDRVTPVEGFERLPPRLSGLVHMTIAGRGFPVRLPPHCVSPNVMLDRACPGQKTCEWHIDNERHERSIASRLVRRFLLNIPLSNFEGGGFFFMDGQDVYVGSRDRGTATLIPSEAPHCRLPVTSGARYVLFANVYEEERCDGLPTQPAPGHRPSD